MKRVIITIVLVLICASLGFVGIKYAGEKGSNPVNNDSSVELSSSSEISNKYGLMNNYSIKEDESNAEEKNIIFNFDKIAKETNIYYIGIARSISYIIEKNNLYDKYRLNLIFENIKLNHNFNTVTIKNYNYDESNCENGKSNVLYFNDNIVKEPDVKECLLGGVESIIVLNDKYLIIHYAMSFGGEVFIFDDTGKEIKFTENIYFKTVVEVEKEYITYMGEVKNVPGCIWNKYKMEIKNDKIINTLLEEGTEIQCK